MGPKLMLPADCGSGAETPGCSWCQHPRQWGWGPATPPAVAPGQWRGGVRVPGGGGGVRSAGGGRAGRPDKEKSSSKSSCWLCWARRDVPRGRRRQSPVKLLFLRCFQREVADMGPNSHEKMPSDRCPRGAEGQGPPARPSSTRRTGGSLFPLPTGREGVFGKRCDSKRDRAISGTSQGESTAPRGAGAL